MNISMKNEFRVPGSMLHAKLYNTNNNNNEKNSMG